MWIYSNTSNCNNYLYTKLFYRYLHSIHLIFYCGLLSIIYILVVWLIGLSQIERQIINSFIPVTIKSKFKHELDGNQILNKIFSKF